ncbi:aminoacyl-tRNA hydrolase [Afifella sp. IM 167]|uniref:aminoacyl-tRNA hydrolase n=1 Tax=Afifella sp. IM 167 TaxID=2033586 RepID=UPI001CCE3305|nr:aminoacyl-tRNA hydrolase [Afifella sp. IM 167]MBZ8134878.1 aminoacyl-tRNA hydrolase [Afifella sp. IM 167]
MLLIVGLGNPGRRYANHRHNIGFMAVDQIHRRHRFSNWRARFQGELAEGQLEGEKAAVLKPATFMNHSGQSVGEAMRFYKLTPEDILVIHDDLDLAPGKVRLKKGGGHGGHNGLRSLDQHIGKNYRRMRLGIGHPGSKELVNGWVLHDFSQEERSWREPLLDAVADNVALLAAGDEANFMNRVHLATASQEEPPPPPKRPPSSGTGPEGRHPGALADGLKRLFGRGS